MYLKIVGLPDFGRSDTRAKLYSGYDFLYCFIKLQATSCVLNSVRISLIPLFLPNTSNTTIEYLFGRLCGFAFNNHVSANKNTAIRIIVSPAYLKNVINVPGMVWPNNTTIKFENEITATTVQIYVLQSKTFKIFRMDIFRCIFF